ncbi:MAG: DNA polymerase III subunit gamma/tau [Chitinophagaceae bacterium]
MDKFIVSARKYRPQAFDTVVGQAHITTTLKNAIKNNQLAHAFLFCGPRGVGKTTCARILAKTINCTNLQADGEACDKCNSCKSFNDGASLNIHELDAASNNSVDDIRSLVEQVRFAPQAGRYKIYIVDEVHMLSASAFNAFLKTLEEPPSYAIFILATTEKHKILPTILSRCQIFDFKRITTNDTVEHLQQIVDKEEIKADKASLQIIAQKSEGCMRDALSILDKIVSFANGEVTYQTTIDHLNILDHDYYFKLLDFLQKQDMAGAMLLYDEVNSKGFEGDTVLNGFAEFLRNILVCKDMRAAKLLDVVEGMQEKYYNVAQTASAAYLVSALNILNEAEINFKMARNKKLHVELAIIKLNFLQQAIDLSVAENGGIVKKKRVDAPVAIRYKPIMPMAVNVGSTQNNTPKPEAKLYVEQKVTTIVSEPKITTSQPIISPTPTIVTKPLTQPIAASRPAENGEQKKSLLEILRQKAGDKYTIEEVKEAVPLSLEKLQECIEKYIAIMAKEGGKLSTISNFKRAELVVENDLQFTIRVGTLVSQKSIEQEKLAFGNILQETFFNPAIHFTIEIVESEPEIISLNKSLNSRERFEHIAAQYPMVKVLKDRLRLDLDII